MCLDICPPADSSLREHEDAVRRTTLWAERQVDAPRAPGQLRFGIAQGGADAELRQRSIDEITALPFDGFALGGLAVGESRALMLETVGWAAPALPAERPRYFMGLGDAEGILEVIARGIDMFDCVLPRGRPGPARRSRPAGGSTFATRATRAIRGRSRRGAAARPASGSPGRSCATSSTSRSFSASAS